MTFEELYENVPRVGFERSIEDRKALFIDSCNRGIKQVSRIRPRIISFEYSPSAEGEKVDVKERIRDAFGYLPRNPVRKKDGSFLSPLDYAFLNRTTIMFLNVDQGEYIIDYVQKPQHFSYDDLTSKLDIELDEDLCDLLVLLVSSYLLIKDDPELAGQYMSLYREREAQIVETQTPVYSCSYRNVTGW